MNIKKLDWPTKSEACPHKVINPHNPAQAFTFFLDEHFNLCIEVRGQLRIEKYSSSDKLDIILEDEP